jgi:uncharacterized protein YxeA
MRRVLTACILTISTYTVYAQETDSNQIPSNSFDQYYKRTQPGLKYNYDSLSQSHNYSGNWDFDKDGKMDELYFTGTGGAHTYYFLKVVLSSDQQTRAFPFIQTDYPVLNAGDGLKTKTAVPGFTVINTGEKQAPSILVRLDDQSFYGNRELQRRQVTKKSIILSFKKGVTRYSCR